MLVLFSITFSWLSLYTLLIDLFKMSALAKLNKQNEQTWINLQKRLNEVQFRYEELFPEEVVYQFIKNKAVSVGSCEGYFIPSLITTTSYLLSCNDAKVNVTTHNEPLNLYTIFIGYPGTHHLLPSPRHHGARWQRLFQISRSKKSIRESFNHH